MQDITHSFHSLPIDGSKVLQIRVVPLKKLYLTFLTFPTSSSDKEGGREYDLLFSKILDFGFDVADMSSKITSHAIFSQSIFLDNCKSSTKKYSAKFNKHKLRHYRLSFESGELNVIAEDCSCHLVWQV